MVQPQLFLYMGMERFLNVEDLLELEAFGPKRTQASCHGGRRSPRERLPPTLGTGTESASDSVFCVLCFLYVGDEQDGRHGEGQAVGTVLLPQRRRRPKRNRAHRHRGEQVGVWLAGWLEERVRRLPGCC